MMPQPQADGAPPEQPIASFVVERLPGEGYRVTSRDGPLADRLAGDALAVLDDLGQPDPRSPEITIRWLPPTRNRRYPIGIRIIRQPDGHVRFEQAWFGVGNHPERRTLWPWLVAAVVGVAGGLVAGMGIERVNRRPCPEPKPPAKLVDASARLQLLQQKANSAERGVSRIRALLALAEPDVVGSRESPPHGSTVVLCRQKPPAERTAIKLDVYFGHHELKREELSALLELLDSLRAIPAAAFSVPRDHGGDVDDSN